MAIVELAEKLLDYDGNGVCRSESDFVFFIKKMMSHSNSHLSNTATESTPATTVEINPQGQRQQHNTSAVVFLNEAMTGLMKTTCEEIVMTYGYKNNDQHRRPDKFLEFIIQEQHSCLKTTASTTQELPQLTPAKLAHNTYKEGNKHRAKFSRKKAYISEAAIKFNLP
ncbi:hypothetical protein M8C21_003181 [Ambrosia artemisiifolia]|uniref:Uncharacterized protein n=1 Tax=Ambrosia artemisiifolia TaxID=4212 RepID=A0AAD5D8Y7_AMBAR|nr:hypothetical protein M8C21_003181 [Ambrosia artemisiifolia]